MKIDALESERIAHIQTRRALVHALAEVIDRDFAAIFKDIGIRLGLTGHLRIEQDGTVVVIEEPVEAPAEKPKEDAAP